MSGKIGVNKSLLLLKPTSYYVQPRREYAMIVGRVLRGVLKIRYLLLGGAFGGGLTLQKVMFQFSYTFLVLQKHSLLHFA